MIEQRIYDALDKVLEKLFQLETETDNNKIIQYVFHIQTLQTKLLYNALRDIDDLNAAIAHINVNIMNIVNYLKNLNKKRLTEEEAPDTELLDNIPTSEDDLIKIEPKLEDDGSLERMFQ